ncbi:MAG TPA: kelch repeat-containing protein [Thermomicrobiales bacterium]|nr:kelch repeat-containing protein [Thermomicrobiales bacterium]
MASISRPHPASHAIHLHRRLFIASAVSTFIASARGSQTHAQGTPGASSSPAPEGWVSGTSIPVARSEFPATVLDGKVYVAGGFGAESTFSRFDPVTSEWVDLASLPEPRNHLGLTALDGAVYLAGGHSSETMATDTFWRYDVASDRWDEEPVLPQGPRGALGCTALDGKVYVVGGSSRDLGGPATNDAAAYDPATGAWTTLPSLPTAREHLSVGSADGLLIAVGGRDGSNVDISMTSANEVFDPKTGAWEKRAALPVPRSGMGVAADGSHIAVIGGEGERGIYTAANWYDPATDTWSALPDLPGGRHGVAAAIVDNRLYAIGGSTQAWNVQNSFGVDWLRLERP